MPVAAVPKYLKDDFSDTSPGMRFSMYLKVWGINAKSGQCDWKTDDTQYEMRGQEKGERVVRKNNKVPALESARKLTQRDKLLLHNLLDRQDVCAAKLPETVLYRSQATAQSPFTTGLGNEHPLENGFAFLNPYGLPYLPGSGVKGVLRQAARELMSGGWGNDTHDWNENSIQALFGSDKEDNPQRGALLFWDVIPQIQGDALQVEVMTPHQSHYYQQNLNQIISPHDSGQPTPLNFLTVPAGSGFNFYVVCDIALLQHKLPELVVNNVWQSMIAVAFEHAFEWLGFGAKTAVGYGAMVSTERRQFLQKQAEERKEVEKLVEKERKQAETEANAVEWLGAQLTYNRSSKTLTAKRKDGKSVHAIAPRGEQLLNKLPLDIRKKIETHQFVQCKVRVSADNNTLIDVLS